MRMALKCRMCGLLTFFLAHDESIYIVYYIYIVAREGRRGRGESEPSGVFEERELLPLLLVISFRPSASLVSYNLVSPVDLSLMYY